MFATMSTSGSASETRPASASRIMSSTPSRTSLFWPGFHVTSMTSLSALYAESSGVDEKTSGWYPYRPSPSTPFRNTYTCWSATSGIDEFSAGACSTRHPCASDTLDA